MGSPTYGCRLSFSTDTGSMHAQRAARTTRRCKKQPCEAHSRSTAIDDTQSGYIPKGSLVKHNPSVEQSLRPRICRKLAYRISDSRAMSSQTYPEPEFVFLTAHTKQTKIRTPGNGVAKLHYEDDVIIRETTCLRRKIRSFRDT